MVPVYREKLDEFLSQYWDYYRTLIQFKETPTSREATRLSAEFDELFSTNTGYPALDDRISKTRDKKSELLMALKHPEVPLHNNESELGARAQVRRRDVSLHTMTEDGTKANDTFLTIVWTAKKLGVSAYDYIYDRVQPGVFAYLRLRNWSQRRGFWRWTSIPVRMRWCAGSG